VELVEQNRSGIGPPVRNEQTERAAGEVNQAKVTVGMEMLTHGGKDLSSRECQQALRRTFFRTSEPNEIRAGREWCVWNAIATSEKEVLKSSNERLAIVSCLVNHMQQLYSLSRDPGITRRKCSSFWSPIGAPSHFPETFPAVGQVISVPDCGGTSS